MTENKTYKMKVELDEDQIVEALATFFGVSSKNVELKLDHKNCHILAEIEKEMRFPEKEKEKEYVYLPQNGWWNPTWDPMKPNIVWCGTQTNPIDISTSPTINAITTGTTTAQMHFDIPNETT